MNNTNVNNTQKLFEPGKSVAFRPSVQITALLNDLASKQPLTGNANKSDVVNIALKLALTTPENTTLFTEEEVNNRVNESVNNALSNCVQKSVYEEALANIEVYKQKLEDLNYTLDLCREHAKADAETKKELASQLELLRHNNTSENSLSLKENEVVVAIEPEQAVRLKTARKLMLKLGVKLTDRVDDVFHCAVGAFVDQCEMGKQFAEQFKNLL
jgi:vacuolar-type H+-ATPase subunit I/STV1